MQSRFTIITGLVILLSVAAGCRSTYYSAWEKLGVHKRDLLKKRVVEAREEQQETSEQFKDALTRLKEITGFEGGDLEKRYNAFARDFEGARDKADNVKERIQAVETVAKDLFEEWEKEIQEITTPSLRANSRDQLRQTRNRYQDMIAALNRAATTMEPILVKFRDQVLYLKHNLNAQAIASLRGETVTIQEEINKLITEMNISIQQADQFIQTLE